MRSFLGTAGESYKAKGKTYKVLPTYEVGPTYEVPPTYEVDLLNSAPNDEECDTTGDEQNSCSPQQKLLNGSKF